MTRARYAVCINNTLMDSVFENIRLFGNGYMAAYFGKGTVENVKFLNIRYDQEALPHKGDENTYVEWNGTETKGYNVVYFTGTDVKNVEFENVSPNGYIPTAFGGFGSGEIKCKNIESSGLTFSKIDGITVKEN